MVARWRRVGSRLLGDYRIFRLHEHETESEATGLRRTTWTIEACDWVNVVTVTPEGQLVLVRQFRHGVDDFTVEIPGGMCDHAEDPAVAAARELLEETGYAGTLELLTVVRPNPAIQHNRCHVFLASNAHRIAEPANDPAEEIEVLLAPWDEVQEMVQTGRIDHALVVTAFAAYERHRRARA